MYVQSNFFSIRFHVHTSAERVHAMYIPGTYIKCTNSYVFAHILDQQKETDGQDLTQDLFHSRQQPKPLS